MKRLIILGVVLAVLGGIGWGVGAMVTQTAATRWLEAQSARGWVAHADEVAVQGFPLRFRTVFDALQLADPETGLAVTTPALVLQQDIFRLDRIRADLPEQVVLASPEERLELTHAGITAALDVQPANRFALDRLEAVLTALDLQSNAGWQTTLASADLLATRIPEADMIYDVDLTATDMSPPEAWRTRLDPGNLLPETIETLLADTRITFDAPWDMDAIEVARPQIGQLRVDEVRAIWGDMLFRASGTLAVTPGGVPEGDLAVRAENWRAMVDLAHNAGLLPDRIRPTAEAMLEVLAGLNGSVENIDATLSFSNGRVFLGPLPLGPAPSLRLR